MNNVAAALPSLESVGIRVVSLRGDLAMVRGHFVGSCAVGQAASFETTRAFSRYGDELRARDVVALDPRDGAVRWRFYCDEPCRACVALRDDRLLLLEGTQLVTRRSDGGERAVVVSEVLSLEEGLADLLETNGELAVLVASGDDERYSLRVIDLERREVLWSDDFGAMSASATIEGDVVVLRAWGEYDSCSFEARDLRTGALRWTRANGGSSEYSFDERWVNDGALAISDPATGEDELIDVVTGATRATGAEARAVMRAATEHAIVEEANGATRLVANRTGETIAHLGLAQRASRLRTMGEGRVVLVGTRTLAVMATRPAAVLAGALVVRGSLEVPPRVRAGEGWIALVADAESEVVLSELSLDAAPRVLPSAVVIEPRRVEPPVEATDDRAARLEARTSWPVDRARFDAILQIAREESWNDAAAWERLVAQELVRAEPPWHELPVHRWVRAPLLARTNSDYVLSDDSERAAWLAFAHDFERVVTATALGRELLARLRPWALSAPSRVAWSLSSTWGNNALWSLYERAEACVQSVVTFDGLNSVTGWVRTLLVAEALWSEASAIGAVLPETAPRSLAGRAFAEVRSPFAPCIALLELGVELVDYDDESFVLGLVGINERGERIPDEEDIPF